jgi:hypothetical protein
MDPEIIQGGLMQNLGMDEGTAYRYAAEISARPELYGDVLAELGLGGQPFRQKFRDQNPRPSYDAAAMRSQSEQANAAIKDPMRRGLIDALTNTGLSPGLIEGIVDVADFVPFVGGGLGGQDAVLAADEARRDPTLGNIAEAGVLGGGAFLGAIGVPGAPRAAKGLVAAGKKVFGGATPPRLAVADLRRQANIERFGYDPSEVVERIPTDDAGFEAYLEKVNPGMKRIAEEARPNLMMGDMYGMMPKGSEVVGSKGNVTFHRSPNGEYYATAFNPDVNEEDVIGYITDRGNGTELAVVGEMQGQGVGGELQYLFRSENPNAPTGGLTKAGESSLRRTYERLADEGIIDPAKD